MPWVRAGCRPARVGFDAFASLRLARLGADSIRSSFRLITSDDVRVSWTGQSYFDQLRQVNVPMVITEYQNPDFKTIHIGTVE